MKKHNIALCGAYDILSYGDSLFPVALEYELRKRIAVDKVFLFAPEGCDACMSNGERVYSYDMLEELHSKYNFTVVIIGGGEMLHFDKISFKDEQGREIVYPEMELWKRPLEFAREKEICCVVNAVGVSQDFTEEQNKVLGEAFSQAAYVTVRDKYSYERLNGLKVDVQVVPDTLWNLERYLPNKQEMISGGYMVLQYGTMYQCEEMFRVVERIKEKYNMKIVIIPINYCHEDRVFAEKAREYFGDEITIIDRQLKVDEIYNIITNAQLFVGTSLHGTLTALSNNVAAIIVDMYPSFVGKMDGMAEWMKGRLPIVSDVKSVEYYADFYMKQENKDLVSRIEQIKKRVDEHFDYMAQKIVEVC